MHACRKAEGPEDLMGLRETQSLTTLPVRAQTVAWHKQKLVILVQVTFQVSSMDKITQEKSNESKIKIPWEPGHFMGG